MILVRRRMCSALKKKKNCTERKQKCAQLSLKRLRREGRFCDLLAVEQVHLHMRIPTNNGYTRDFSHCLVAEFKMFLEVTLLAHNLSRPVIADVHLPHPCP